MPNEERISLVHYTPGSMLDQMSPRAMAVSVGRDSRTLRLVYDYIEGQTAREPHLWGVSLTDMEGGFVDVILPGEKYRIVMSADGAEGPTEEVRLFTRDVLGWDFTYAPVDPPEDQVVTLYRQSDVARDPQFDVYKLEQKGQQPGFIRFLTEPTEADPEPVETRHFVCPGMVWIVPQFPDSSGSGVAAPYGTTCVKFVQTIDADVNSDNQGLLDRTCDEDLVEEIANDEIHPGLLMIVNDHDQDDDHVPDSADGYDRFSGTGEDVLDPADDANTNETTFADLHISLPNRIGSMGSTVKFDYDDSDPLQVERIVDTNVPEGEHKRYVFNLPEPTEDNKKCLRLWTRDGNQQRDGHSVLIGGDFIPSGMDIPVSELPHDTRGLSCVYIEAVRPSESPGDLSIKVSCPALRPEERIEDTVRVTSIQFQKVAVCDLHREANRWEEPNDYHDGSQRARDQARINEFLIGGWGQDIGPADIRISCDTVPVVAKDKILWKLSPRDDECVALPDRGPFEASDYPYPGESLLSVDGRNWPPDPEAATPDFLLRVGLDMNGDKILDPMEMVCDLDRKPIRIFTVTATEYATCSYDLRVVAACAMALPRPMDICAKGMLQFLRGGEFAKMGLEEKPEEYLLTKMEMPGLGVDCIDMFTARVPTFTIETTNKYSEGILESMSMKRAIIDRVIEPRRAMLLQPFQDPECPYFSTPATFNGSVPLNVDFWMESFLNVVTLNIEAVINVNRDGSGKIVVGNVEVCGSITDNYDWSYDQPGWIREAATVQACYEPVCGRANEGRVFRSIVNVAGTIDLQYPISE